MAETPGTPGPVRPEAPVICPACGRTLAITELACEDCQSTMHGVFAPGPLSRLPKEQQRFLVSFVRSRGNIRELERELGQSYPTVRARLDQLIAALDGVWGRPEGAAPAAGRRAILDLLDRGEITAGEAIARLREM
ncbi:MAG: DUF2089 domain-containing protein [Bacteroidota bacterium]